MNPIELCPSKGDLSTLHVIHSLFKKRVGYLPLAVPNHPGPFKCVVMMITTGCTHGYVM